MTFLPIVDRELRVAARRHFTYWSRISAAAFALIIFGAIYALALMSRNSTYVGPIMFGILKWMCFVFACCAGVFLTSDSVSEEKREGTIGLLFLTDLRGHDVVLGKLLSQSLRAFYGLLAVFPILALPLMLGGVTGGEFGRSVAVLVNTLFLSLALGLFVSTISRDSTKAMNATLFLMLLLTGGLLVVDMCVFTSWTAGGFNSVLSIASPAWLFGASGAYPTSDYWSYFGLQHGMAWAFLVLASLLASRTWHEKSTRQSAKRSWFERWRFGGMKARLRLRRIFLERNPVMWLGLRDRWMRRVALVTALLLVVAHTVLIITQTNIYSFSSTGPPPWVFVVMELFSILYYVLKWSLMLWVASSASKMFVDAVRNGAMELLLVTPLRPAQIVRGHLSALWRTFRVPVLCVLVLIVMSAVEEEWTRAQHSSGSPGSRELVEAIFRWVSAGVGVLATAADFAALGWFGMWMGLNSRRNSFAVLKTLTFVSVLPMIAFWFVIYAFIILVSSLLRATTGPSFYWILYSPVLFFSILTFVKAVFFIWWARRRLRNRFREAVLQERKPLFRRRPPPALQAGIVPPPPLLTR